MADCVCMNPPFHDADYDTTVIGVDKTSGRFAEVTIETCKRCGSLWLRYCYEIEAFSQSGRWYRGLVTPEVIAELQPEHAPVILAALPWYFYGGSYYQTTGQRGMGAVH